MNRDELRIFTGPVTTAEANFGSTVNPNQRRFIYRVKVVNENPGSNLLTLKKSENGGVSVPVDYYQTAVQYETQTDPEDLLEDSEPLYIVEGGGSGGTSYLRAVTDTGNAYLTIWYIDAIA